VSGLDQPLNLTWSAVAPSAAPAALFARRQLAYRRDDEGKTHVLEFDGMGLASIGLWNLTPTTVVYFLMIDLRAVHTEWRAERRV